MEWKQRGLQSQLPDTQQKNWGVQLRYGALLLVIAILTLKQCPLNSPNDSSQSSAELHASSVCCTYIQEADFPLETLPSPNVGAAFFIPCMQQFYNSKFIHMSHFLSFTGQSLFMSQRLLVMHSYTLHCMQTCYSRLLNYLKNIFLKGHMKCLLIILNILLLLKLLYYYYYCPVG